MALGIDFVLDRPITTVPTCSPLGLATVFLHIRKGKTYKVNKPVATKESIGNFDNVLELGYYCVTWIFGSQLVRHFTLRVQQSAVKCETQTKDKVFVNMVALTQYRDSTEKASETFYKLSNTRSQLQAYVFDVIRDHVPKLNLDHAFKQKHDIAKTAESLKRARSAFGFKIVRTLIVDTEPERGK